MRKTSFRCSKKVAFMRSKKVRKLHLFSTKVAFVHKHCKWQ